VAVSVLDEFREAEHRVAQRLKELEPVVAEYRELEAIAQRLGMDGAPTAMVEAGAAPTRRRRRASRAAAQVAPGGDTTTSAAKGTGPRARRSAPSEREQQVLKLVRDQPGITVAEAGKKLGVDPTGLYRVVHRLERRGDVAKTGRKLEPGPAFSAG
jgi:hypothetical protein